MKSIMFLTHMMSMGFGVSVVVHELCKALTAIGHSVCVGTLQSDYKINNVQTYIVGPDSEKIRNIAVYNNVDVIIAHTSPYFEILPALKNWFECWVWEHGDPSPDFFTDDKEDRKNIIQNKQLNVYPNINGIITISKFVSHDTGCIKSEIVYNGCDHMEDFGKKSENEIDLSFKNPLKIGTLMRLGQGEALYKGNELFLKLCGKLKTVGINAEFCIMGRGERQDALAFSDNGFTVHLNASDEERAKYLRELDIFISPSLWEGFNLPIAEAMRSGTLTAVFDVGAHPEVCPFIFSGVDEMVTFILFQNQNRELLRQNSERCYDYVNRKFSWEQAAANMVMIIFDDEDDE